MNGFLNPLRTPAALDVVCIPLPVTGAPVTGILAVAVTAVLFGALLLFAGRRGRRPRSAALWTGLIVLPAVLLIPQPQPATAAVLCPPGYRPSAPLPTPTPSRPDAPTGTARVTVVQTSVNTGMAPGVAPTPLFGEVRNTSRETVYVTDVVVRVTGVTKAPGAAAGPCGPSDYRITGDRMPVGAVLTLGQKVRFTGARIAFVNKSVNQDACRGAVVALGYTSS